MISYRFLLILSMICNIILTQNNKITITGTIQSDQDMKALEGANIVLESKNGKNYGTSSDAFGKFIISNLNPGQYKLNISFIGYQAYNENLNLENNKKYTVDALLSVESILMTKLEIISDIDSDYKNIPGAASIINEKSLKLISPIGTQEILEHVPGVNAFSDDGIGNSRISVGIRGLNPRRSSRILILEDGVPIQPALYVYPNMYYNPPVERINRVEVIKGSGSISYGPQTMGGIINYITKRPDGNDNKIVQITSGENGYNSLFFESGNLIQSNLNPEFQLLFKKGDGFRNNNDFEQTNATIKFNYITSNNRTIYSKTNFNFENSNATYTGLTKWTYDNFPNFNPKKYDEFKIKRFSSDLIITERINSNTIKSSKAFISYFDRRWWRENDMFIKVDNYLAYLEDETLDNTIENLENYIHNENPNETLLWMKDDLIRVGNRENNFGILRTFYVLGLEQDWTIDHSLFRYNWKTEIGGRIYFERFVDDRVHGDSPDSRDGIYFEGPDTLAQVDYDQKSHHYESVALSSFISSSININNNLIIRPGMRLELFEQERVDRLNGAIYQDKTSIVALPGIGFNFNLNNYKIFGGIHRGFTPPSSGALNILNFGDVDGGLDVKAEKSWNKELGLRYNQSILNFEVTYFHIDIEDMVAAGRSMAFNNLGKVVSKGIELSSELKFSNYNKFLPTLFLTYTNLDAKVEEAIVSTPFAFTVVEPQIYSESSLIDISGKTLPYSPQHTLILGLENSILDKIHIRFDYKYVSEVYSDFLNVESYDGENISIYALSIEEYCSDLGICGPIKEYGIINMSAKYDFSPNVNIQLSIKNLADKIYVGSMLHSSPYKHEANISSGIITGPRRQINLSMKYLF